ncbi:hypothetical protein TA3x_000146 [Tundrisphaera sp. TA3]|uniref:hypothetical protein n=1 Tax=Tundrisphaera sp. TA3 TaxID=3435775 RepID=UPI003EBC6035
MTRSLIHGAGRAALLMAASVLACGCGDADGLERAAVSGKVTLDGKPLERGDIQFIPKDGDSRGAARGSIAAGEYSISAANGPAPGEHLISITPNAVSEAPSGGGNSPDEAPGEPPAEAAGPAIEYIPTAPLEAKVAAGQAQSFDFGLTTKPGRRTGRP